MRLPSSSSILLQVLDYVGHHVDRSCWSNRSCMPPTPACTDFVVDVPAVEETAAWAGVAPTIWPRVAHDCMLDTRWHEVADSLRCWLETF